MKNRRHTRKILFISIILSFFTAFPLSGINFSELNLSNDDKLLFKVHSDIQNALFVSNLTNMSIQQLTFLPEKIQLLDDGSTILAINRFGAASIPLTGGLPSLLPKFPSLANGNMQGGRTQELAASGDGRWIIYIETVSPAYGNLFLTEVSSGANWLISEKVELSAVDFPAKWSPDSRLFVYSKSGRLYYFPIISDISVFVDERFRLIGQGGINSVLWGAHGEFYYFSGNTLYRITNPGLFTHTIYGEFLSIGNVNAVLPVEFDFLFDRYWIAPDSGSILINKGGRGFFVFLLGENKDSASPLPYLAMPYGAENFNVLWSDEQLAIAASVKNGISVWRLEIKNNHARNLTASNVPLSSNGALSPDGSKAVFWGEKGLELWDFTNWRLIQRLSRETVLSCAWINNERLVSGNNRFLEEIINTGANAANRQICLSNADEFGFEANSHPSRILAKAGNEWFATDGKSPWVSVATPQLRQVLLSSEHYRVFLEPQHSGNFSNIPMIRNVYFSGTAPLISDISAYKTSTVNQSQVALCFDLYDDDTGLLQTLAALRKYGIKATFFLNGDFIRRNPPAAAAIAEAGHEIASLFFAPIDFSNSRYRITQEFVTQGLVRNEDEFNNATGKELSLLWHTPFYRSSDLIISAAASAGYRTVTRTIDPGDWLSKEDAVRYNIRQTPASQMVEFIMDKMHPDAVIPIRLGLLSGGRDDYLFQRIEILLDALTRSGVKVVPVSALKR
jgi:peptidoglycan/xylan/chitin deacetylase (PgdA/CDA1 family)